MASITATISSWQRFQRPGRFNVLCITMYTDNTKHKRIGNETLHPRKEKKRHKNWLAVCHLVSYICVLMKVWPVVSEILKVKHNNNDLEMWAPKFYCSITILLQWLDACSNIQVRKSEKADCVGKTFRHLDERGNISPTQNTEQNRINNASQWSGIYVKDILL